MTLARRIARWSARAILALLAFALAFPLLWRTVVPAPGPAAEESVPTPPSGRYDVYVVDWGYHTSIVVRQPAGWTLGPPGREAAPYLEYAWGDRRFYRDSDYRPHSVYATLFLPTASVTYLAARDRPPHPGAGPRAVWHREVDSPVLRILVAELEGSMVHDDDERRRAPSPPVAGYAGRFYPARGSYLWTRDCNAWTVDRLAAAGLATRGGLVVFSGQVAGRLVGFARQAVWGRARDGPGTDSSPASR